MPKAVGPINFFDILNAGVIQLAKASKTQNVKKQSGKNSEEDQIHWYDHPEWYEAGFMKETPNEAKFLEDAFRKFVPFPVERVVEAGCGSGRLVREMARRGYAVTGIDLNDQSLKYCKRKLDELGCRAVLSKQDMTDFQFDQPFDAAFNAINTFRHLETEAAALKHLKCVANHLRTGGIFILSLHLVPHDGDLWGTERWSVKTPDYAIKYALKVTDIDEANRLETLKITMKVTQGDKEHVLADHIRLRLYDVEQIKSLLAKVKAFELVAVYDFWYDIKERVRLTKNSCDTVLILQKK